MDYKTILVHLDNSTGCANRLDVAIGLAREFDARLMGLFVVPSYLVPSYVEAQVSADLITEVTERAMARARDTVAEQQKVAEAAGVSLQTAVIEGQPIPLLREYSRYADLLVLGQDDPDDADNASYGVADALLFEGACACLVVPHSGSPAVPGKRVLLAWNASRESARALREAMPLLQRAEQVSIVTSEGADAPPINGEALGQALRTRLSAHGIDASDSGFNETDINATDAIIGQAADMDADLIVMGAYGHARLREIILGGVTRDLLKRAPTCLLLAH